MNWNPKKQKDIWGGGNKLKDNSGKTIITPNLTFHETGIGTWSIEDFKKALKTGISKDNSIITFPMPMYSELTDDEITSIYEYLKTIPKINRKVKRN